jgi:hypothetical protein
MSIKAIENQEDLQLVYVEIAYQDFRGGGFAESVAASDLQIGVLISLKTLLRTNPDFSMR